MTAGMAITILAKSIKFTDNSQNCAQHGEFKVAVMFIFKKQYCIYF